MYDKDRKSSLSIPLRGSTVIIIRNFALVHGQNRVFSRCVSNAIGKIGPDNENILYKVFDRRNRVFFRLRATIRSDTHGVTTL